MEMYRRAGAIGCALFLFMVLLGPETRAQSSLLGGVEDPYPLRPADTSSPRDTLRSFMRNFTQAVEAWRDDRPQEEIGRAVTRAADTVDFSEIPVVGRASAVIIDMALIREILDRVELPQYEDIPGDDEVAGEDGIARWVIPNTKIEIVRIDEGPNAGQFLFSKETVARIPEFFELVKTLPYKSGALTGIYDEIRSGPGNWVSHGFPDRLPSWARTIVWSHGIWQWVSLCLLFLVSAALAFAAYRLGLYWDERKGKHHPWLRFGVPVALLVVFVIARFAERVSRDAIGLLGQPQNIVSLVLLAVTVAALSWFAIAVSGRLAEAIGQNQRQSEEKRRFTTAFLRIVFRLLSLIFLALLGIGAAEAIGIPIAPLVAGLGVGGLAIALAVRPTLENVIGGLTLFADRPVRVGDFCLYGDKIGTVEEVGLRSTRIRTLERSVVTVANAEFSQMQLDNFSLRDQRLLKTVLQLRYETTPDQMRYVLAELRKLLLGHPMVTPDPARVRFVGYGAFSKDLEVFAYIRTSDHDAFLAIQEDILLRMEDIIGAAGTGFAFPSQTMYFTRDAGVDAERGRDAETKVEDWRQHGRLPFPDFDPGLRWEMEDTLDYPPRGAFNHRPREEPSQASPGAEAEPTPAAAHVPAGPNGERPTRWARAFRRDRS